MNHWLDLLLHVSSLTVLLSLVKSEATRRIAFLQPNLTCMLCCFSFIQTALSLIPGK